MLSDCFYYWNYQLVQHCKSGSVREVRQIRKSEYVVASKCMGWDFPHSCKKHLGPNFVSAIKFMVS